MISPIFDAVRARIVQVLNDNGNQDGAPFHELGEEHIVDNMRFPSIVWVPMGGPIVPARQRAADGVINVPQIATRQEDVRIHIWHEDFRRTEKLMGHLVAVMRELMTGFSFKGTGIAWSIGPKPTSNEPSSELKSGTLCILTVQLDIPLTAEPLGIAIPRAATIVPQVNA